MPGHLDTLKTFVAKAEKLAEMRFTKHVQEHGSSISGQFGDNSTILWDNAPDQEAIEAFLLTFRQFLINNEAIAISRMPGLYRELDLPERTKTLVADGCAGLKQRLDSPSQLSDNNGPIPLRQILDTFMYGGLVHGNVPSTVARFEEWRSNPLVYGFMRMMFITVLMDVLEFIWWMHGFHKETIRVLEGGAPRP